MKQLLENNPLILAEASIVERLRRSGEVELHDTLVHAPLIYDKRTRELMGSLYKEYMSLAVKARLPMLICTPTWRTNKTRVYESDVNTSINVDAVHYLHELRDAVPGSIVKIGGLIGCKGDCYQPDEGLSVANAQQFHAWQIEELVKGGVDFLIAETLPNVQEALGIAKAMQLTEIPYIISFVISHDGSVLDGTGLDAAIDLIDSNTSQPPLGYMVNCAHPSFLCPEKQPAYVFKRLIGYLANASSLDHCDLDNTDELKVDSVEDWGNLMLELNQKYGVRVLGGCCGTDADHLQYLINNSKN